MTTTTYTLSNTSGGGVYSSNTSIGAGGAGGATASASGAAGNAGIIIITYTPLQLTTPSFQIFCMT